MLSIFFSFFFTLILFIKKWSLFRMVSLLLSRLYLLYILNLYCFFFSVRIENIRMINTIWVSINIPHRFAGRSVKLSLRICTNICQISARTNMTIIYDVQCVRCRGKRLLTRKKMTTILHRWLYWRPEINVWQLANY